MVAGRPRTTTPPPEKCIELGKKLVKWATEKTEPDEPLRSRFCEWYTLEEIGMIKAEWKLLIQVEEFWPYYEQAQAALGRRIIDGTINPSIGHRFMWYYVPEAKEQEFEKMQFESDLKKQENAAVNEQDKARYDALMYQLSAMQSASNSSTSTESKDNKS